MPAANPFVDPPRLSAPTKYRLSSHSRSGSRSPAKQHARDHDPLLRDLSPSATLRAFVTDPNDMTVTDALTTSIRSSSMSERALGAKAAQACLDLRSWTDEMEAWHWPGTFDYPDQEQTTARLSTMTFNSVFSGNTIDSIDTDQDDEHWGCLPAKIIQAYEKRCDEIGENLQEIDVEEMKEYVLATHYRIGSRPSSRDNSNGAIGRAADLRRLDDFTALVTATILQALPYFTRLNRLLDTWTVRLTVLRNAPTFLRDLKRARTDLDHGWAAIAVSTSSESNPTSARFDRQTMLDMRVLVERQVRNLGRRLDRFLDDLEGRDDTIPDAWIDHFELLESAYGTWIVQAEHRVLEAEWKGDVVLADPQTLSSGGSMPRSDRSFDPMSQEETPQMDNGARLKASADEVRSSSQTHHLLHDGLVANSSASSARGFHSATSLNSLNGKTVPILLANAAESSNGVSFDSDATPSKASREASPSPSSVSQEGQSQVAKRRAAFLGEIERTNSLKQSKSPPVVRPFEHASNAFTRLFKKERSPEQPKSKSKRPVTSKLSSFGSSDDISSAGLRSLSNTSTSSSRLNMMSTGDLSSTTLTSARSAQELTPKTESQALFEVSPNQQVSNDGASLAALKTQGTEGLKATTRKSDDLSSPFHSPSKLQSPPDWPSRSEDTGSLNSMHSQHPQLQRDPVASFDDGLSTPVAAMESDVFDKMFVQSLPKTPPERPRSARGPASLISWAVNRKRASSLPRSLRPAKAEPERPDIPSNYRDMIISFKGKNASSSRKLQRPPAPLQALEADGARYVGNDDDAEHAKPNIIKRASVTSIELFSRAQVKSIDVAKSSRQSSVSSRMTPPQTPQYAPNAVQTFPNGGISALNSTPMSYKGHIAFPTPPGHPGLMADENSTSEREAPAADSLASGSVIDGVTSYSLDTSSSSPSGAPLNVAMKKRRIQGGLRHENEVSISSSTMTSPNKRAASQGNLEDNFDRHVSEVLERLPSDFRFKARAGAETPISRAGYSAPRPKIPHSRKTSRDHSMTIAPAESSPKKSSLASDPEVKLYHLTQAGREEPIKLFVRLVGEGERVMVRVGGGWADLADYLRQYADHHGSRTVSEGNFEVQTMPNALTRRISGPAEPRSKTPVSPRPDSSDSDKDWPIRSTTSVPYAHGRTTPASERERQTPTTTTPKSTSTGSRPSTANASRPPSRQAAREVGLSGTSSGKKDGLSEHKAKWVEGMLERAKQASAEKTREDNQKYFSELGKAGGTRRVIFRSTSGTGAPSK